MLICLALLLSACGGGETSSAASGAASGSTATSGGEAASGSTASTGIAVKENPDQFTAAFNSEPGRLDPQSNTDLIGGMIEKQVYEALFDKDAETGEFIPVLATEWEWVDDTHLSVTLREGVKFHNGEDFTADDVAYTISRFPDGPATGSLFEPFDPEGTEIVDDYHIIIAFKRPFAPALNYLSSSSIRAFIVPHDYMEANGEDCLNQNPVGTGPYQFVDWVVSSHVDLTRFDGYWGDAPAIKDVRIRFIPESTARTIALETGEIDLAAALDDSDIESILAGEKEHILGYLAPGLQVNYLAFNYNFEPFQDIRVRQAIAYGVNWEDVAIAAGETTYVLADSCLTPPSDYYVSTGTYAYDPDRAKELLAEAGYADGFEIHCIEQESPAMIRSAEAMQAYLADLGITLTIEPADAATWQDALNKGTCDISIASMTAATADPAHALNNLRNTSTVVVSRVDDERFNELMQAGTDAMDETERTEVYAELQQYVYDNVLEIPVHHRQQAYGVWDYVDGFYPEPHQLISIKELSFKTA